MATNNYFKNFNSFPQQELINDLTREVIQMSGTDILYLPRTIVNRDDILGEDASSKFMMAYEVEMYINSNEGFAGAGDVIAKFGLDVQDEISLVVNKERFKKEVQMAFPREGDLIYLPMSKSLFDVKFVEHEKPFYSMGKNQVFELTCEKFQYSNEKFQIPAAQMGAIFDTIERSYATTITLTLEAGVGKYIAGETVFQGTSGNASARGLVSSFAAAANKIFIYNTIGTFTANTQLTGETSSISRNVTVVNDQEIATNKFAHNDDFEVDGDNILDFSEVDPWAEGDL